MTFHWLCCSAETERTLAMLDDLQTQRDEEDAAHIKKVVARADSWMVYRQNELSLQWQETSRAAQTAANVGMFLQFKT
eukprot:COSAG02_NODE_38865_length_424_cov_0.566154_1_plen_77_part_10